MSKDEVRGGELPESLRTIRMGDEETTILFLRETPSLPRDASEEERGEYLKKYGLISYLAELEKAKTK